MDFLLRKWADEDAQSVCRYANNKRIASNLRDMFPYPYTMSDAREYVCDFARRDEASQCCRAIVIDGEAVGSIGVFLQNDVYRKSAEIGYWLGEPFWGNGIITEAIKRMCEYAFKRYDIVRIYAGVFAYNKASCRALEKAGFEFEGVLRKSICKNGVIYDSRLYALVR